MIEMHEVFKCSECGAEIHIFISAVGLKPKEEEPKKDQPAQVLEECPSGY